MKNAIFIKTFGVFNANFFDSAKQLRNLDYYQKFEKYFAMYLPFK
jgi:hypothetical protein